jgi:hypothetical protein
MLAGATALFPVRVALAATLLATPFSLLLGVVIPCGAGGAVVVVVRRHDPDCDTS